jgi:chemotaxis protein histidine kinase CheA
MIVECDEQKYAIPSDSVTTVVEAADGFPVLAEDNFLPYDGTILRIIDLKNFFYPRSGKKIDIKGLHYYVVCKELKVALMVDRIMAHQKIVAKDFAGGYKRLKNVEGIGGYTILGNEDIILIIDVPSVAATAA